jgi:hypothetical protein
LIPALQPDFELTGCEWSHRLGDTPGLTGDADVDIALGVCTRRPASGLEELADWATQHAVAALLRGCPPGSAEAAEVVNRILEPNGWSARREELLAGLEVLFDPRIDRYWQLTAIINGLPPFPTYAPAVDWLIAALRTHE